MKILIVEGDEIVRRSLVSALNRAGHEPIAMTDGDEALRALRKNEYQFVISDSKLTGVSGPGLCRAIRQCEQAGYVYVILLVDPQPSEEIIEGMWAGADDFLIKPISEAEIAARVRSGMRMLALSAREMVIFALANRAETRDVSNGRHLERLTRYCRCLAEALHDQPCCQSEIDPEFVRTLYRASALHDIGKIAIPDGILLKPGPLSYEEFGVVKTHSEIGAHMLDAAVHYSPEERFLRMARDVATAHHERWDGLGYPHGVSGTAIPLAARIVAVADIYDALTSKRVYRDAISHTSAREIIASESGGHLDPMVVEAFFTAEQSFLEIRARFKQRAVTNECVACAV